MSASYYVRGFKPPDNKWKAMKACYDSCKAAGVDPPGEVDKFFNYEEPDDSGVLVEQKDLEKLDAVRKYSEDGYSGYDVILDKLPKDVKIIRFIISW